MTTREREEQTRQAIKEHRSNIIKEAKERIKLKRLQDERLGIRELNTAVDYNISLPERIKIARLLIKNHLRKSNCGIIIPKSLNEL